jgi:hypothetical protein
MQHIALTVVAITSLLASATQGMAIELGELQALPSRHPPYIFRLSIRSSARSLADTPAVRVRQPQDALSVVRNNVLELRLGSLTDVELEVSANGQTLNRLLLTSELLAARARLSVATASLRPQPAPAIGPDAPTVAARPLTASPPGTVARSLLEHEVHGIRQEMQTLVGRVTPWQGLSPTAGHSAAHTAPVFEWMLWGALVAGVALLCTGYAMQRRAVARQRQRQRALLEAVRCLRGEGRSGAALWSALPGSQEANMRRVRVLQTARRRVRALSLRCDTSHTPAAQHTRAVGRISQTKTSAPTEVVEALANLRRELLRLQRLLPTSTTVDNPTSPRGPA